MNSAISCLQYWEMASEFTWVFGTQEIVCQTGQFHDLGKYSEPFYRRLHGGPSVDHAIVVVKIAKMLASVWVPKYKLWLSYLG